MGPDDGNHWPNRKGRRREAGSEGSVKRTPAPGHTKRMRHLSPGKGGTKTLKPDGHPEEGMDAYAADIRDEGRCAIPSGGPFVCRMRCLCQETQGWTDRSRQGAWRFYTHMSEGPNMQDRQRGPDTLTNGKDAGRRVGRPGDSRKEGDTHSAAICRRLQHLCEITKGGAAGDGIRRPVSGE